MPAADLKFYQDQARELDDLTARISNIARARKGGGRYNSAADGVQRVMNEGVENQLGCRWRTGARSATSGGFKGAVDFLPLDQMVLALGSLVEVREQDQARPMRDHRHCRYRARAGDGERHRDGGTAERAICAVAAPVPRRRRGAVLPGHGADSGEIIAKHFQPQTLLLLSDFQQTTAPIRRLP